MTVAAARGPTLKAVSILGFPRRPATVSTMRIVTTSRRRPRAAQFIEFALVLPAFMFLLMFVVDMSVITLVNSGMQEATYNAARFAAQRGGTSVGSTAPCANNAICATGPVYNRFVETVRSTPLASSVQAGSLNLTVVSGAVCSATSGSVDDTFVTLRSAYSINLITPGLSAIMKLLNSNSTQELPGSFTSTAVARCEVVR